MREVGERWSPSGGVRGGISGGVVDGGGDAGEKDDAGGARSLGAQRRRDIGMFSGGGAEGTPMTAVAVTTTASAGVDGDPQAGGVRPTWRVSTLHRRSQRMTGQGQDGEDDDREEDISFVPRTTTYSKLETVSAAQIGVLVRLLYMTVTVAGIYTAVMLTLMHTKWRTDGFMRQSMLTAASNATLLNEMLVHPDLVHYVDPPPTDDPNVDPYRCQRSLVVSGIPGDVPPSPDPCIMLPGHRLPTSVKLLSLSVQLVFAVLVTLLALVYAVRILRHRGRKLVTHEQVWVLLLLVSGSLFINIPIAASGIWSVLTQSSGNGSDELSLPARVWQAVEPAVNSIRDGAFTVSTLFFVWASMCSLRILDPQARLGLRFYAPKVVALVVYFAGKFVAEYKFGIHTSAAPIVSAAYLLLLFTKYDLWTGRAFAITYVMVLTAMEIGIIGWIVWEGVKTGRVLKAADYMRTRSKQVTFRYYAYCNSIFYVSYTFLAGLLVSLTPTLAYVRALTLNVGFEKELLQLDVLQYLRFGFYAVFFAYVFILAYVNLPADSKGILGWFRGEHSYAAVSSDSRDYSEAFSENSDSTRTLPSMGPLCTRLDAQPSETSDRSIQQPQTWWRWAREDKKGDLGTQQTAEPLTYRKREARRHQHVLKASCFVLQTHAALLNFAWLASYVETPKMKHVDQLQAQGHFTVGPSFHDAATDTRAIVVDADDRIIVAFKGTTSTRNLRSNLKVLNSKLSSVLEASAAASVFTLPNELFEERKGPGQRPPSVDSNSPSSRHIPVRSGLTGDDEAWLGVDVEMGPYGVAGGNRRESVRLSRLLGPKYSAARVHRGFADAYLSVAQPLVARVRALLKKKARPVYLTGHSLGGALATICSLDLWAQLPLSRHEIGVTTFGSPKVGNFAFQRTYDAVLPTHWRIMLSADLIVTLPKMMYCHVGKKVVLTSDGQIFLDPNTLDTVLTSGPSASFVYHRKAAYLLAFRAWSEQHHGSEKCGLWDWPYARDDARRFGHAFRAGTVESGKQPLSREFRMARPTSKDEEGLGPQPQQESPSADADAASVYYDVDDDDDDDAASDWRGVPFAVGDMHPPAPGLPGTPSVKRVSSHHGIRAVGKVMTPLRRSYANRLAVLDAMVDAIAPAPSSRPMDAVVVARWARLVRRAILAKFLMGGPRAGTTRSLKDTDGG
ncbi:hypothetical protein MMPV_003974 [Pyropia vietnamensis]